MAKIGPTYIFTGLLMLFTCSFLQAQVSIRASADRERILIGEPVSVSVEAYVPLGATVNWFPADSIAHFETLQSTAVDTAESLDGKKITQVLTITSFDSGRWQIPPFEVLVDGQPYYSDSISVDVSFTPFDPRDDYRDIKDIIITEDPFMRYIPWIIGGLVIVLTAALAWLIAKRKFATTPVRQDLPKLSPLEEALQALAALRKQQLEPGQEKNYYTAMNDILRKYLGRRFSISTFERTNEELILQIADLNIPKNSYIRLAQSLRMSDFVKFAKYRPSDEDNRHNIEIVQSSIEVLDNNNVI